MKRKLTISAALILLLSILLCSCGEQTASPPGTPAADKAPATEVQPPKDTGPAPDTALEQPEDTTPPADTQTPLVKPISDIKAEGRKVKIACIGDSITAGTGITDKANYSYPAVLGKLLGDGYEVGNFGIGGSYILPSDNKYNKREKC